MKYFRLVCWVPVAAWIWARLEVDRYDGWGAWAAAPMLLAPVALSALLVGLGLILVSRPGEGRRPATVWVAIGVAGLPLLWIALRIVAP